MGLFSWLFGSGPRTEPQQATVAVVQGPGTYSVCVVGESNYQNALEWITGGKTYEGHQMYCDAVLVPEHGNSYDANAVRVDIAGYTVGYLDRETAWSYRQRLSEQGLEEYQLTVRAVVLGGWNRGNGDVGHYGVKVDLPTA